MKDERDGHTQAKSLRCSSRSSWNTQQALIGLACDRAWHTFISARMEQMSLHHEALARLIGSDKAIMLVASNLDRL
ncbi:MAG: hypothetical protein H0V70_25565 [Ktedonobacteraceae bacterium]|nr:hypothetical protein [Ktedonobacteraceae bacterium]